MVVHLRRRFTTACSTSPSSHRKEALALLEMAVGGSSGGFGRGARGAFRFSQKVQRDARTGGQHLLERQTIRAGIVRFQARVQRVPGFAFVGDQDGTGEGGAAFSADWRARRSASLLKRARDDVEEGSAEAVETGAVFQPGGIAAEPAQQRRQVRFAPLRAHRAVDGVVQHHRWKTSLRVGESLSRVVSRPGDRSPAVCSSRAAARRRSPGRGHWRASGWLLPGWWARRARSSSRPASVESSRKRLPLRVSSSHHSYTRTAMRLSGCSQKVLQEGGCGGVRAGEADAAAHHVLRGQPHDAPRQRVDPPGFQRLLLQSPRGRRCSGQRVLRQWLPTVKVVSFSGDCQRSPHARGRYGVAAKRSGGNRSQAGHDSTSAASSAAVPLKRLRSTRVLMPAILPELEYCQNAQPAQGYTWYGQPVV